MEEDWGGVDRQAGLDAEKPCVVGDDSKLWKGFHLEDTVL